MKIFLKTIVLVLSVIIISCSSSTDLSESAGTLDNTFNSPEGYLEYKFPQSYANGCLDMALQNNGQIIALQVQDGSIGFSLVRFNSNGTMDATFGNNGKVDYKVSNYDITIGVQIDIQSDDKILVCGTAFISDNISDLFVIRFNSNGSIDQSFGTNGVFLYSSPGSFEDYGRGIKLQPDGKILVTGNVYNGFNNDLILMRIKSDGSFDDGFGNAGIVIFDGSSTSQDLGNDIDVLPDYRIVVCGITTMNGKEEVLVLRYLADGKVDPTFGDAGFVIYKPEGSKVATIANNIELQPNGRINVVSTLLDGDNTSFVILRFKTDGVLDNTFGWGGVVPFVRDGSERDFAYNFVLQPDGKAVILGNTKVGNLEKAFAYRFSYDGGLDPHFGDNGIFIFKKDDNIAKSSITCGIVQKDSKILMAGYTLDNDAEKLLLLRLK